MQKPTDINISTERNPAVAEALRDATVGQKVKLELQGTIKTIEPGNIVVTEEAWVPEGYELDESGEENSPAPMASDAMMSPAAMAVRKKKAEQ